jgi:hypothetical protein
MLVWLRPVCAGPYSRSHRGLILAGSFRSRLWSQFKGPLLEQHSNVIIIIITWSARQCQAREPCRWPLTKLVASKINSKTSSAGLLS